MLSLEELSRLSKSELLAQGYELITTYPRGGSRVTSIRKIVTTATATTLEKPTKQKSWKKILEESMHTNSRSTDLHHLFSGFLYRIIPSRIRSELGEVIHELEHFKENKNIILFLSSLNQKGSIGGLEYSNYIAGKKYDINERTKYIADNIVILIKNIKNSKDYSQ